MPRTPSNLSQASKGRKTTAQGNALGNRHPTNPSPEGATKKIGWRTLTLGELGHWYGGGTPSKARADFWTDGNIPWVSPKDMKTPKIQDAQDHITKAAVKGSSTSLVPPGSVLVVVRSGILKHTLPVAITEREVTLNQDLKAITPKEEILPEYLALGLKAFERKILDECCKDGTTVQNIKMPSFLRFELPIAPLPEQRRIVARIEELFSRLDAGVAALLHAKAQLQRYRQSVLAAAVTGQLTQAWREQHPDTESAAVFRRFLLETRPHDWTGKYSPPIAPALEKRYEIPDSWTWMSTDELIREPLKNGLSLKGFTDPPGVAVLKLDALNENGLDYSKRQYLRTDSPKVAEIQIEKGDFLISRGNGSLRLLAKGVIADVVPDNVIYPDTMIRFRFPSTVQRWISIAWRSRVLREQIETRAKSTAGIYKIAQGDLRPIAIPIPPLAEQHQIVAEVEARTTAINRLEDELESKLRYATKLRQSILKSAFLGIL